MAEQNPIEQCLIVLTNILNRQTQPTLRSRIEKDLRYLPSFEGKSGTLPAFISSVERVLTEYGNQAPQAYIVIYNEKILGPAKNYLEVSPPETWEQCKAKLKLQYKATKEQGQIVQEINTLKVSSIIELMNKIRILVEDISECAMFSDFPNEIINNLSSVLVLRIKEITAGALAAELYNKFSLEEIRPIINKYMGQDSYNLKTFSFKLVSGSKEKYSQKQNNQRMYRNNFERNNNSYNSEHFRPNDFNNDLEQMQQNSNVNSRQFRYHNPNSTQFQHRNSQSRQFRHDYPNNSNLAQSQGNYNRSRQSRFQPRNSNSQEPMDIDASSVRNEVNQLGESEFFIN